MSTCVCTAYQATPKGQWKKIDSERSFSGTITIGQYQNPDNANDTRYCRCMGRGDTDTPLGVLKAEGTTPKEMLSAFGEFTNGKTTQLYTWDTNIPSLQDAKSVTIEITDETGTVTTATLNFLKYENAGRRLYYADGYPFNLSKKIGNTLNIKVSW